MDQERFVRAQQLTEAAFRAAADFSADRAAAVEDLRSLALGDGPAIAMARARVAAHLAHRSTEPIARLAVSLLDGAEGMGRTRASV